MHIRSLGRRACTLSCRNLYLTDKQTPAGCQPAGAAHGSLLQPKPEGVAATARACAARTSPGLEAKVGQLLAGFETFLNAVDAAAEGDHDLGPLIRSIVISLAIGELADKIERVQGIAGAALSQLPPAFGFVL
jgi:hypothetical protein